jgi:hypothetical protein
MRPFVIVDPGYESHCCRLVCSCMHSLPNRPALRCALALVGLVVAAGSMLGTNAMAQSADGYDLHWNALGAGGGMATGPGGFTLNGTLAQTGASAAATSIGTAGYALRGGFWAGAPSSNDVIFRNGFEIEQ